MAALIIDILKLEKSVHMLSDDSISPAMRHGACFGCWSSLCLCGREARSVPGNCHGQHFWSGLNCDAIYKPNDGAITFSLGESHNAMEAMLAQKEDPLAIKGNQGQCLNFLSAWSEKPVLLHDIPFDKQEEASFYERFRLKSTDRLLMARHCWKETHGPSWSSLQHEKDSCFKLRQAALLVDADLREIISNLASSSSSSGHPSGHPSHNCPILKHERNWNTIKCLSERILKPGLQDRTNCRYNLVDARPGDVEQGGGSPSSYICNCVNAPSSLRMFKEPAAIILQAGVSLLSGNPDSSSPSLMNRVTWYVLIGTLATGFICSIARELLLVIGRRRGGAASRILQCISVAAVIAGFLLTMLLLLLEHH